MNDKGRRDDEWLHGLTDGRKNGIEICRMTNAALRSVSIGMQALNTLSIYIIDKSSFMC